MGLNVFKKDVFSVMKRHKLILTAIVLVIICVCDAIVLLLVKKYMVDLWIYNIFIYIFVGFASAAIYGLFLRWLSHK